MRFSRDWIAAYTRLPDTDPELADALSGLGLVVDAMDPRGDDLILDLDVAANRPDVMNHLGVARELAIGMDQDLEVPAGDPPEDGPPIGEIANLEVEDAVGCPRLVACAIVDVDVGPSPDWLVERLEAVGVRPINSVVDITNYVMWELGRPMHAYDLDRLADQRLRVRRAGDGETVLTLDGVERDLSADDLVIADAERPVGLAGVMGGEETGVTASTKRVLLECAVFDPSAVRATARRHGMHTDASHRFERGLTHEGILRATRRAAALITEIAGGRCCSGVLDARGEIPEPIQLQLPDERLSGLLGVDVPAEQVTRILTQLGFQVRRTGPDAGGAYDLTVPVSRPDVQRPVDVIEEIARFWGYERLPDTLPVLRRTRRSGAVPSLRHQDEVRRLMSSLGYWESLTFTFTDDAEQRHFLRDEDLVALSNPLNESMSVLRAWLVPGLLAVVARNLNVGTPRLRLFELGRTFREAEGPPVERRHLAIAATGNADAAHFQVPERAYGFADLKGAVEGLARRMGWPPLEWRAAPIPGLQDGSAAELRCDGAGGLAGRVDPAVAEAFGIDAAVWVAELDIDDLVLRNRRPPRIVAPPRYPAADRDVSLLIRRGTPWACVRQHVLEVENIPLETLGLVDVYEGEDLPEGQVAMTVRLTFRSRERTLTTEQIEAAQDTVLAKLETALGARRR